MQVVLFVLALQLAAPSGHTPSVPPPLPRVPHTRRDCESVILPQCGGIPTGLCPIAPERQPRARQGPDHGGACALCEGMRSCFAPVPRVRHVGGFLASRCPSFPPRCGPPANDPTQDLRLHFVEQMLVCVLEAMTRAVLYGGPRVFTPESAAVVTNDCKLLHTFFASSVGPPGLPEVVIDMVLRQFSQVCVRGLGCAGGRELVWLTDWPSPASCVVQRQGFVLLLSSWFFLLLLLYR